MQAAKASLGSIGCHQKGRSRVWIDDHGWAAAGLTQEQLAFEVELERNYISMLERGERQPTLTTLIKLARPLRRKASYLVALVETASDQTEGD